MSSPIRHFIGRSQAAPQAIVAWCRRQWPEGLPDGLVFCVPTSLALRRLRDALTVAYGAYQGVKFLTPPALFSLFEPRNAHPVANDSECLILWDEVFDWLKQVDPENDVAKWLLPKNGADWLKRPAARYAMARRFLRLRRELVEGNLDFAAVAAHPAAQTLHGRDCILWNALDAFEQQMRAVFDRHTRCDPADAQRAILQDARPRPGESCAAWRLVLACVPDFMPALEILLRAAPACDILVQAQPEEAERFDAFGRPAPDYWCDASKQLSAATTSIRAAENPEAAIPEIDRFLARQPQPIQPEHLCLAVLDAELIPPLSASLAAHGLPIFKPDPIPLTDMPPARALQALLRLTADAIPERLRDLLCLPEVCRAAGQDYPSLRSAYNTLVEQHRPLTLRDMKAWNDSTPAFKAFLEQCGRWMAAIKDSPVEGARAFLLDLYGQEELNPKHAPLRLAAFEALYALLEELETLPPDGKTDFLALLLARIADTQLRPARDHETKIAYEGRFEVLWSPAEMLVFAGLEEGIFPDTVFEDTFLPNAFRKALGLRDDRVRTARDAYLLDTACAMRAPDRTLLLCTRSNARGDWLKPSRLLFLCSDAERARRAKDLFTDPVPPDVVLDNATCLAFKEPPHRWRRKEPPLRISPSDVDRFRDSPLMWWLTSRLGLRDVPSADPEEIDATRLGILIHAALKDGLPQEAGSDEEAIASALCAAFDRHLRKAYGAPYDVELMALCEAGRLRLRRFARYEAESRRQGWETRHRECQCEIPAKIGNGEILLKGIIDRIDYHPATGAWRILDYKTGHTPPKDSLQLPMYRLMARQALGLPADAQIAYLHIPSKGEVEESPFKAPGKRTDAETEALIWQTLDEMVALGASPIPPQVGKYGNPLLQTLVGHQEAT